MRDEPLVSVVTPVYNGEPFLAECIESILSQTYKNFEYHIVNNCSTDRTLEIAKHYARKDDRIRVHTNHHFVGVMENHNIALNLISAEAKYCKVVCADDGIFSDCLEKLVEVAEANPSVGIVGSYQLSGSDIKWQGFPYPKAVFSGREICRKIFLEGDRTFGFGTPTSLLYQADLIRKSGEFYPNASPHADTSACFKALQHRDFGFVYQVLSYERIHTSTQSTMSQDMNRYSPAYLSDVMTYGPHYLSKQEFDLKLKKTLQQYYEYLAINVFRSRGQKFWDYHKTSLNELGFPVTWGRVLSGLVTRGLRELTKPKDILRRL